MPAPSDARGAEPFIVTRGLTVRFGSRTALEDVDVAIDAPATGLLGANGAGKSTLMKAVLGLIPPAAGTVTLFGRRVGADAHDVRRRLGYMPERACLPREMTAADLVVHMGELRGLDHRTAVLRASEVLFQVGLEEERSRLIGTFSTGMAQRTKLAQALVHSPDLVILDEPTNGLDPAGREEMLSLVRRLSADLGIAVIMSSHVLEDIARTCDAVVVLREGRLAHAGRIDALRAARAGGGVRVRAGGSLAAFMTALTERGCRIAPAEAGALIVRGDDPAVVADGIRDAAALTGTPLHEVSPAGGTLEDALAEVIG